MLPAVRTFHFVVPKVAVNVNLDGCLAHVTRQDGKRLARKVQNPAATIIATAVHSFVCEDEAFGI